MWPHVVSKTASCLSSLSQDEINQAQSVCHVIAGADNHDDVIKWKHFPRYWPFVRGIHRSPVNSPHKCQWLGALMFSLICTWINAWVNNRETGALRRHRAHYDVTVMLINDYTFTGIKSISHNVHTTPAANHAIALPLESIRILMILRNKKHCDAQLTKYVFQWRVILIFLYYWWYWLCK